MNEIVTDQNQILKALSRFSFLQAKLNLLIEDIELATAGKTDWFTWAPMIARKFWKQAVSLEILFTNETTLVTKTGEKMIVDLSSYYSLLRGMFEAYAVFCHLFKLEDDPNENIIRFHLWQLDGLSSRLGFKRDQPSSEVAALIENDKEEIEKVKQHIVAFDLFKSLNPKQQDYLLKRLAWKFSLDSLKRGKDKWQHTITELIDRTKIKRYILDDLYSYYSMHAHTGYINIIQNDDLPDSEKLMGKWVAIMNASFVTAFMIEDLSKMFKEGKNFFDSLAQEEREVITSFAKNKD